MSANLEPLEAGALPLRRLAIRTAGTVGADWDLLRTAERMRQLGVRSVPVIDASGRLEGIVTDRDLAHYLDRDADPTRGRTALAALDTEDDRLLSPAERQKVRRRLARRRVRDVLVLPPLSVDVETSLAEAVNRMEEYGIDSIPVLRDGRLAGLLFERDLRWAFDDRGALPRLSD